MYRVRRAVKVPTVSFWFVILDPGLGALTHATEACGMPFATYNLRAA